MIDLILASNNNHKALEFAELFELYGKLFTLSVPKDGPSPEETGTTFFENALIKAKAFYDQYKRPVMSDDSGLVVSSMPTELGVQSARFGGDGLSDRQRAELLLERLKDKSVEDKKAYFICVLCFYLSPSEIYYFEGRMDGNILDAINGDGGFGYDPVFHPTELDSLSQNPVNMGHEEDYGDVSLAMVPNWKKTHSHRAKAVELAAKFFLQRDCQNPDN